MRQGRGPDFPVLANGVLALICLLGLVRAVASLTLHIPFDLNEGWNAYHAAAAISGGALYPPAGSFVFNNYPPLSFYLVGALGVITQDDILAGRIVSLAAFLATGLGIAAVSQLLGAGRKAGLFGALFFMVNIAFDTNRAGISDPQMLGHALGLAGLWLALKSRKDAALAGSACLLALAFFTKHNLFIQPIALFVFLALTDRAAAVKLAGFGLAFAAIGAASFQLLYQQALWRELNSPRLFHWGDVWAGLTGWLETCGLPLAASVAVLAGFVRDRAALFCLVYLAVSLVIGTGLEGGAGTMSNVLFDNLIALALCAALGLEKLSRSPPRAALFTAAFFLPVVAMLLVRTTSGDFYPRYWLDRHNPAVMAAVHDIALIRAEPGPVLCADLALCYWAGKPATLDEWGMNQAILTKSRSEDEVVAAITSGRYQMIVMDISYNGIWQDRARRAVAADYRLLHNDDFGMFWAKRP